MVTGTDVHPRVGSRLALLFALRTLAKALPLDEAKPMAETLTRTTLTTSHRPSSPPPNVCKEPRPSTRPSPMQASNVNSS
ncbi:hypothetical protein BKA70DRAFT_793017 [Coprinopsis sp. MPI-PUGE-AT-0042]|nr:hypothetical protein BKA70DRAFT_793017 [Coprinopsis sp. MPI-PUGE-AT-0042]